MRQPCVPHCAELRGTRARPSPEAWDLPSPRGTRGRRRDPRSYILASRRNGTLYVGVTSDLLKRVWEHKNDTVEGFTKKYRIHDLVWFEPHETMESAMEREKGIKKWNREWKLQLIEQSNLSWRDLYVAIQ